MAPPLLLVKGELEAQAPEGAAADPFAAKRAKAKARKAKAKAGKRRRPRWRRTATGNRPATRQRGDYR